ncbi:MAG: ribosome small subunit-dependent GTPase A, partial [Firmicutes bacterium]|nr:ribosome small subunit-dependent GTPase A [Bacillota bacterium]
MHGMVVKTVGGFCFVRAGSLVFRCAMRGKIKLGKSPVLVGDGVEFALTGDGEGVVGKILPRRNMLMRPSVA